MKTSNTASHTLSILLLKCCCSSTLGKVFDAIISRFEPSSDSACAISEASALLDIAALIVSQFRSASPSPSATSCNRCAPSAVLSLPAAISASSCSWWIEVIRRAKEGECQPLTDSKSKTRLLAQKTNLLPHFVHVRHQFIDAVIECIEILSVCVLESTGRRGEQMSRKRQVTGYIHRMP